MSNFKNPVLIGGALVLLTVIALTWNYTEALKSKNRLEVKSKLAADCSKKFPEMEDHWAEMAATKELAIRMVDVQKSRCEKENFFDLNSPFFCRNHKLETHSEESFVEQCIDLKFSQIQ